MFTKRSLRAAPVTIMRPAGTPAFSQNSRCRPLQTRNHSASGGKSFFIRSGSDSKLRGEMVPLFVGHYHRYPVLPADQQELPQPVERVRRRKHGAERVGGPYLPEKLPGQLPAFPPQLRELRRVVRGLPAGNALGEQIDERGEERLGGHREQGRVGKAGQGRGQGFELAVEAVVDDQDPVLLRVPRVGRGFAQRAARGGGLVAQAQAGPYARAAQRGAREIFPDSGE